MADRTYSRLAPAKGQIWEGRQRRRDGSRDRVRVVEADGRKAVVESLNPLPGQKPRREVGLLFNELTGGASLGNMRLVEVDGRAVSWRPGEGMVHG